MAIKLSIVGVGKIVRDQHLPAIGGNGDFELVATASRHGTVDGVPAYTSIEAMLDAVPEIEAVSLCMPPQYRYDAAKIALERGKHVFLEKPPGATISEVQDLARTAEDKGLTLFASWHSRYAPAVEAARAFLASTTIQSMQIIWKEDVRHWHPNQEWIWQAGGLGVFDPGINALSIMTHILPRAAFLTEAELTFPENRDAPIAALLSFRDHTGLRIDADFDWRQTGKQSWDIVAETSDGQMVLSEGGGELTIAGQHRAGGPNEEYPELYRRFADLVKTGRSDTDLAPLTHVADAFMLGKRKFTEAFCD
jgi:D-galactose 1-dehydrogenase